MARARLARPMLTVNMEFPALRRAGREVNVLQQKRGLRN
jgi:hypothetical protein